MTESFRGFKAGTFKVPYTPLYQYLNCGFSFHSFTVCVFTASLNIFELKIWSQILAILKW